MDTLSVSWTVTSKCFDFPVPTVSSSTIFVLEVADTSVCFNLSHSLIAFWLFLRILWVSSNFNLVSPSSAMAWLSSSSTPFIFVSISPFVVCSQLAGDGFRPAKVFFCTAVPTKTSLVARKASSCSDWDTVPVVSWVCNTTSKSGWLFNFASKACEDQSGIVFLKGFLRLGSDNVSDAPWRLERSTTLPPERTAFSEKVPPASLASLNLCSSAPIGTRNSVGFVSSP